MKARNHKFKVKSFYEYLCNNHLKYLIYTIAYTTPDSEHTRLALHLESSPRLHFSHNRLFGDLDTTSGTKHPLDVTVDGELASGKSTNLESMLARSRLKESAGGTYHEQTSTNTSIATTETELLTDLDETRSSTLTRSALGLVDLGKHSVSGLRDESGGETSNETGAKVNSSLGTSGHVVLVETTEDSLGDFLENDELGHSVGDPGGIIQHGLADSVDSKQTYCLNRIGPKPE